MQKVKRTNEDRERIASLAYEVGRRAKSFFVSHKIRHTEFADAVGVTPTTVSNRIQGKQSFGTNELAWMRKRGCDLNWLLTGEESDRPQADVRRAEVFRLPVPLSALEPGKDPRETFAFQGDAVMDLPAGVRIPGVANEGETLVLSRIKTPAMGSALPPGSYVADMRLDKGDGTTARYILLGVNTPLTDTDGAFMLTCELKQAAGWSSQHPANTPFYCRNIEALYRVALVVRKP